MDLYDAIRNRCSVRAYEPQSIEDDKLQRVLEAARLAPSARNRQQWRFIVVTDQAIRGELAVAAEQPFVGEAPVVVAAVGLTPDEQMHCEIPTDPVDCAIALEHIALAATAEGLGTCWIGHFDQAACCRILGVPATARIIELMPLGYPAGAAGAGPKSRKPLDEIVCHDRFC